MVMRKVCSLQTLPAIIFMYRDGCGEGQVAKVISVECRRLRQVIKVAAVKYQWFVTWDI